MKSVALGCINTTQLQEIIDIKRDHSGFKSDLFADQITVTGSEMCI